MNADELIESFQDFKEFKNIDRVTMMHILEDVIRGMIIREFEDDANFDIIINPDKGDLEIWRNRTIVEDGAVEDPLTEIEYSEAIRIEPDFEIGEEASEELKIENFGRRAILSMRQNLQSKIQELEKDSIYKKYKDRVGDIITGEVYQIWKREILVLDDEGNELVLPKMEQIPTDYFKKGDTVRAVVSKVDMKNTSPVIILSRTSPSFLERLFEMEVPEIFDGLITIKKIVREPGERAKVAVESYDDRIDPVGACVGVKGARIHGIVRELRNENIDVINYTTNDALFIQRAIQPAVVSKMDIEGTTANVFLESDQVSLAIGRSGHNIKLASKLTGYQIEVYRVNAVVEDDVDLDEFLDEIDEWIIEEFKRVGLDTAKDVLRTSVADLLTRTDLEEETISQIHKILRKEFEEE